MALVLCVIFINYSSAQVNGQSIENEVDQVNTQTINSVERGSTGENVGRNLASFKDSSFSTVSQHNNQLIDGISDHSTAVNQARNFANIWFAGGSDISQNNLQK